VAAFDIDDIVQSLQTVRQQWREVQKRSLEPGGRELPAREALAGIVETLKGVLFPMRLGPPDLRQESENFYVGHALDSALHGLFGQAQLELQYRGRHLARDDAAVQDRASAAVRASLYRLSLLAGEYELGLPEPDDEPAPAPLLAIPSTPADEKSPS